MRAKQHRWRLNGRLFVWALIAAALLGFLLLHVVWVSERASSHHHDDDKKNDWDSFATRVADERRAYRQRMQAVTASLSYLNASALPAGDLSASSDGVQILLWDNPFGTPFYWGQGRVIDEPNYGGYRIEKAHCPVRCDWQLDKRYASVADVVVFDPCAIGSTEWRQLPPQLPEKRPGQRWLYFAYEQPAYFQLMQQPRYLQLFDAQMSYDRAASLQHITLMCGWGVGAHDVQRWLAPPPAKRPDRLVAFMASNCHGGGAEQRTAYVRELMSHIDVHSFGLCLHNRDSPYEAGSGWHDSGLGDMMKAKLRLLADYKFALVFENSYLVDDYVTEKLATALLAGTVPVYLGADTVDDWLPGPHSIIRADRFASPALLAAHLHAVAADEQRYAAYFAWKQHGLSDAFRRLLDNCVFNAECNLCRAVQRARHAGLWPRRLSAASPPPGPSLAHDGGGAVAAAQHAGVLRDAHCLQLNRQEVSLRTEDQYVELLQPCQLHGGDVTVAVWLLGGSWSGTKSYLVDNSDADAGFSLAVVELTDTLAALQFCLGLATACFHADQRVPVGRWVHVAVVLSRAGSELAFYVDGTPEEYTLARPVRLELSSVRMRFGKQTAQRNSWRQRHPDGLFDGSIDDVVLYRRALSTLQLQQLMFVRPDGPAALDLAGYWSFNEGAGDIVHDSSPHAQHARIFGQPQWQSVVSRPLSCLRNT